MFRGTFGLFLALLLPCGSGFSGQAQPDPSTGLEGVVKVSPARPGPLRAESELPNAVPLPNAAFTVANDKGTLTTFTTDADGRFRISLPPGRYVVSLAEHRFPRPCGPFDIEVVLGKMTSVEWHCDTGMR
jgi:hypothetical protein